MEILLADGTAVRGAPALREEVVRPQDDEKSGYPLVSISNLYRTGGLRQDPGRAAESPAEARTYGNGSREMHVLVTTFGSRRDIELVVGLASGLATRVMTAGVWL
jgi:hypothetical protein